jgi:hypothetical protein
MGGRDRASPPAPHKRLWSAAPPQMVGAAMSCGVGVDLCGVLALMTGLGSGVQNVTGGAVYGHPTPVVHGLWPQTPPFGDSACVAPSAGSANATRIYSCYQCTYPGDTNCSSSPHHSPTDFQHHEWSKHGVCAGAPRPDPDPDPIPNPNRVPSPSPKPNPNPNPNQECAMRRTTSPRSAR